MNYLRTVSFLGLVLLAGGVRLALADTISFFNTGVDANGVPLTAGTADPHYTLIYSADPSATQAMATAATSPWVPASSTAGWISPGASFFQNWDAGYYVYETTLDLTGYDPSTAILSGMLAADDSVQIYLNRTGAAVFSGNSGYGSETPFLINGGFVNGLNQVDFVVYNQTGPTGLMVDDTLATAETPEPGSLLLLGTGLAAGAFQIMRRKRTGAGEIAGG